MSLEKLCVFLVAIARYAYEDVVRAADSLVDVGGDDINKKYAWILYIAQC